MFTVYYIVKNEVYSFINFNMCLFHKILSTMNGGVHFQECYIETQSFYNVITQKLRQTIKNCFHSTVLYWYI